VTLDSSGYIDHSDSLGATARFGHGDAQWMTAGRGIVHAEMFPLVERERPNPTELFQIWLNLPRADKMVEPYFTMFWDHAIGQHSADGVLIRVVAGRLDSAQAPPPPPSSWAARPESDVAIWTIRMRAGSRFSLPPAKLGSNRTVYFFDGSAMTIAGEPFRSHAAVRLEADAEVVLEAGSEACELLLLQGKPLGEPVVQYGPFVMNTPEEIRQAVADYQRTRFGGWPWPSDGPVHDRARGRFARHADGREEAPDGSSPGTTRSERVIGAPRRL
jgi:hypothetical protein